MIRIMTVVTLFVFAAFAHSDIEPVYTLAQAQKQVDDYRALRRACSITRGEQRRVCFSRLSQATDNYTKAKEVLKMYEDASPMLGQVEIAQ